MTRKNTKRSAAAKKKTRDAHGRFKPGHKGKKAKAKKTKKRKAKKTKKAKSRYGKKGSRKGKKAKAKKGRKGKYRPKYEGSALQRYNLAHGRGGKGVYKGMSKENIPGYVSPYMATLKKRADARAAFAPPVRASDDTGGYHY